MKYSACTSFLANQGVQRREFLRAGALGLLGLGLPTLLEARAAGPSPLPLSRSGRGVGVRGPRAKACILLFMWGGPAQQDTWDMKPDAPVEYRGQFRPIGTSVPGLSICEHLPRLAQRAHQLALIRSMTHNNVD